jgi:hypothetical protein
MSRVWKDRVEETTSSVGTANFILTGATDNFQPFSVLDDGDECDYCVVTGSIVDGEMAGTAWEVGSGTYDSGTNVLSRDTVYDGSSGAGVKISLTGESVVFITIAALRISPSLNAFAPLVTGALPGPEPIADGFGQFIMVPI